MIDRCLDGELYDYSSISLLILGGTDLEARLSFQFERWARISFSRFSKCWAVLASALLYPGLMIHLLQQFAMFDLYPDVAISCPRFRFNFLGIVGGGELS